MQPIHNMLQCITLNVSIKADSAHKIACIALLGVCGSELSFSLWLALGGFFSVPLLIARTLQGGLIETPLGDPSLSVFTP